MAKKIFALLLLLSLLSPISSAQRRARISPRNAENILTEQDLYLDVQFLSDTLCQGRRTGTPGSQFAAMWIAGQFDAAGLKTFGNSRFQSFRTPAGPTGHNVLGFLPGTAVQGKRYIVIGAHFDHQGILGGALYPGADSNASGVVAMIQLARMLSYMTEIDRPFAKSVIFVAFDGKGSNMSGSTNLVGRLLEGSLWDPVTGAPITAKDVDLMVNIDQIGCDLAPLSHVWKEYIIMLSDEKSQRRVPLTSVDLEYRIGLDIGFTYYDSKDFTRLFFRKVCDQKAFLDAGIESVLFTSGITMNNNKTQDTVDTINTSLLRKRIILIYYWLRRYL